MTDFATPQRSRHLARHLKGLCVGLLGLSTVVATQPSFALDLSGTAWEAAGREFGIDPTLLFSVALVESAKHENRYARPWPWALNGPKGNFYGSTREEAERRLTSLSAEERKRTAIGMMQVYVGSHGHRVARLSDLLDPILNLKLGASILRESLDSSPGDMELGIGRYNAWQNEPVARSYGQRVLTIYQRIKHLESPKLSLWN